MATTIHRLTMYALISALERDLRDFLGLHVAPLVSPEQLLSATLKQRSEDRFKKDNPEAGLPDLEDLIEYLDLADEIQVIRAHDQKLDSVTQSYIKKYYIGLEGV